MRFLMVGLVGLVLGCGDGDRSVPAGPAGKASADCTLAEIFSGKEGCQADPSLDEVPAGYVPPVDTTATAPADTTETAPADTLATAPADTVATAPADTVATVTGGGGGETWADAADLAVGSSRSGEIETGGVVDWFRVQVRGSGSLTVFTGGSTDTYGTLQNSSGSELATDDDGGRGQNFSIEHAVSAGTYYIQVRGFSSSTTGSYTVHARFQSGGGGGGGETWADAVDLAVGSSRSGRLETDGDVDWFRVQVSHSGILTVFTGGSTDTYGTLQNSSGSELATDDDGGRGRNFSIARSVSAGTYYIQVRGFSSSTTGSYTVHARFRRVDYTEAASARAALDSLGIEYTAAAFIEAAKVGNLDVVRLFVESGMDVNAVDWRDRTALPLAARYGHLSVVEFLVGAGASLTATDRHGSTALHAAAYEGHLSVVKFLVGSGADVNARALHSAASGGRLSVVEFLVGAGADVNATNRYGVTALPLAARYGHLGVVKFLVGSGADVNARDNGGETTLHWAARGEHLVVVKYLVGAGADVNAADNRGRTPRGWAYCGWGVANYLRSVGDEGRCLVRRSGGGGGDDDDDDDDDSGGGGGGSGGGCYVGQVVGPGQSCRAGGGSFRNVGDGCFVYTPVGSGRVCGGGGSFNGLGVSRSGDNFRITAVP